VDIRFWGDSDRRAPTWVVDRVLRQLGEAGETGVLFLRALGETDSEIHLRGGHVVGCFCVADPWLLARRLVSAGVVDARDMGALASCDTALHDVLDEVGLVDPVTLHSVLAERFRDTFHFACATTWQSIEFLRLGSLLLPPSAPGAVPAALLARVDAWRREVGGVLGRLRRSPGVRVLATLDPAELTGEAAVVLARIVRPTTLSAVVATSPIERYRTLAVLARMAGDGSVLFEDEHRGTGRLGGHWGWIDSWGRGEEDDPDGSAVMMEEE
jgi:hypothetical protein